MSSEQLREKDPEFPAAFFAFGLFLGALVGLSEGIVAGGLIAAIFSLAGATLGILSTARRNPAWLHGASPTKWLLPISLGAIFGLLGGLTLRLNDVLVFRSESLPARLERLGFNKDQQEAIMDRWSTTLGPTLKQSESLMGASKPRYPLSGENILSAKVGQSVLAVYVAKNRLLGDEELVKIISDAFPDLSKRIEALKKTHPPSLIIDELLKESD
jgi:hypothetical protein